jgi:Family of unknown function (DUF5937)
VTELVLAHVDLARIRFAHSPVRELVASLGVLREPGRQYMYGTWLSAVRGRLDGVWLELLTALAPAWSTPSFVVPPPTGPLAVLAGELDAIAATPPATVRADLEDVYRDRPLPAVLRPLHDDPDRHLTTVVQELDGTGRPRSTRSGGSSVGSARPTSPTGWTGSRPAAWCASGRTCILSCPMTETSNVIVVEPTPGSAIQ